MKRIILILIILLVMAGTAVAKTNTEYWLLTAGNDAYILCDSDHFVVTVNGADSLYVQCMDE